MKVSEIILEAPQTGANAFSQMANQLGNTTSSTGGKTSSSSTGKTHKANPNNPNKSGTTKKFSVGSKGLVSNAGGKQTSVSPKDALKSTAPDKVAVAQTASKSIWSKFTGTKIFRFVTNKYLGPVVIWLDDMSSINELWDAGAFNDHGDKAGEVAQQLRTYYTQLLITRMATMWVAWGTASFATGMAVRGLVALIPGLGWLANLAAFAAQAVVYALLNTEAVQKYLTFKILENLVPEWINDPVYGFARVFGAVGSTVPAYITQLKKKWLSKGPEAAKDAANAAPGAVANVARDAANAVKNTGKAAVSPSASPSSDDDGISGADLAKKLF